MKRNLGLVQIFSIAWFVFFIGCFYPQLSYATPPETVQIKYDLSTQTLSVTITHNTIVKGSHYIKFVEIKKNGTTVSINTYDSQPTGASFTYHYRIPAIEEDTFQAVASCNLWGSKASSLLSVTN